MFIDPRLGVFWRSSTTLQVGLDPRLAIALEGLDLREQEFVSFLTTRRTPAEIDAMSWKLRISQERRQWIIDELRRHDFLGDEVSRIGMLSVRLVNLDPLSVSIAYALVRAGIRRILYADPTPLSEGDHPALLRRRESALTREAAFALLMEPTPADAVRVEPRPSDRHVDARSDVTIVTGSRAIDPLTTGYLMEEHAPHLLVWMEDVDMCIGPLVEPYASACARCLYHERLAEDPAWRVLFPQALAATPLMPTPHLVHLVGELVARSVVSIAHGRSNVLFNRQWRIPLRSGLPYLRGVEPHPACGCSAGFPAELEGASGLSE